MTDRQKIERKSEWPLWPMLPLCHKEKGSIRTAILFTNVNEDTLWISDGSNIFTWAGSVDALPTITIDEVLSDWRVD